MAGLAKTDKARVALQARSPALSAMDRRLLILSDGQRDADVLLAMFGADVAANLERLLREGYLAGDRPPPAAQPDTLPAVSASQAATPSRRSLVAAKMYLLDMLQLQRNEQAAALRAAIQAAPGDLALVRQLCEGLRHLQATTAASYAGRVALRLGELLPEAWLSELQPVASAHQPAQSSAA